MVLCEQAGADSGLRLIGREIDSGAGWSVEISAETLEDKNRGDLLTQLPGNLNGLTHENKYYNESGNVEQYTPCLPSLIGENPLIWMLEVDGLIVDARTAPLEFQQTAYQLGLIPYIPGENLPQEHEPQSDAGARIIEFPSGRHNMPDSQSAKKAEDERPGLFEGLEG